MNARKHGAKSVRISRRLSNFRTTVRKKTEEGHNQNDTGKKQVQSAFINRNDSNSNTVCLRTHAGSI